MTTGVFYVYYKSKEELFDALVGKQAGHFVQIFSTAVVGFERVPKENQLSQMGRTDNGYLLEAFEYAYDNKVAFRQILCASSDTEYENYIHQVTQIEMKAIRNLSGVLRGLGYKVALLDPNFEHAIMSGMFSSFFELIIHEYPKETVMRCVKEVHDFYTAGWARYVGL